MTNWERLARRDVTRQQIAFGMRNEIASLKAELAHCKAENFRLKAEVRKFRKAHQKAATHGAP